MMNPTGSLNKSQVRIDEINRGKPEKSVEELDKKATTEPIVTSASPNSPCIPKNPSPEQVKTSSQPQLVDTQPKRITEKKLADIFEPDVASIVLNYCKTNHLEVSLNVDVKAYEGKEDELPEQPLAQKVGVKVRIMVHPSWLNGLHDPDDLRDGLVFEALNFSVIKLTEKIQLDFQGTNDTLEVLGKKLSDLEARTVFHSSQIYQIFDKSDNIKLSKKAIKQLRAADIFAPNNTLKEYQAHMFITPHEKGAKSHMGLLTPHVYMFNWVVKSGGSILAKKVNIWVDKAYEKEKDSIKLGHINGIKTTIIKERTDKEPLLYRAQNEEDMQKKAEAFNEMMRQLNTFNREYFTSDFCKQLSENKAYHCPTMADLPPDDEVAAVKSQVLMDILNSEAATNDLIRFSGYMKPDTLLNLLKIPGMDPKSISDFQTEVSKFLKGQSMDTVAMSQFAKIWRENPQCAEIFGWGETMEKFVSQLPE
jgi:hypothetical protein